MTAPTSDERREVAERLRDEAGGFRRLEKEWGHEPTIDLGDVPAVFQDVAHFAGLDGTVRTCVLFDRLAALIDTTCHIEDDDWASKQCMGPMLTCDRCANAFPEINGPYQYCPCCGARVVDDEQIRE